MFLRVLRAFRGFWGFLGVLGFRGFGVQGFGALLGVFLGLVEGFSGCRILVVFRFGVLGFGV